MYAQRAKVRCYGRISLMVCMSLFLYAWVVFNVVFLARIVRVVCSSALVFIIGIPANLLWILAVWSYLTCGLTDPGQIADEWRAFVRTQPGINIVERKAQWQPGQATTSDKTPEVRPERAHYCKVCNVDVLRMDHFCPWVGNCIGFRNYKFFLLSMIYLDLACLAGLAAVISVVLWKISISADDGTIVWFLGMGDTILLSSLVALALLAGGAFTYVLCHHLPKALRNTTTIENKYKNMPNPYDQLSRMANLAQVFGAFGWDWFLPVMPRRPQSDGFSFRKSREDGVVPLLCEPADYSQESESDDFSRIEEIWRYRYTQRYEPAVANHAEEEESDEETHPASMALICCRRKKRRSVISAAGSPESSMPTTATVTPASAPLLLPAMAPVSASSTAHVARVYSNPPGVRQAAARLESPRTPRTLTRIQMEPKVSTALLPTRTTLMSAGPATDSSARLVQLQPQVQPVGDIP